MYYHSNDLHQAVKSKKLGDNKKGKSLVGHERSQRQRRRILRPKSPKRFSRERERPDPLECVGSSPYQPNGRFVESVGMPWNRVMVSLLRQVSGDLEVLVRLSLPLPSVGWTPKMMLTEILLCRVVACLLFLGSGGGMAARKALIGTATWTLGPRARNPSLARLLMRSYEEHNVGNLSLEVVEQGWSGWLVDFF